MTNFQEAFAVQLAGEVTSFSFYIVKDNGPLGVEGVKTLTELEGKYTIEAMPGEDLALPTLKKIIVKKKRKYTKRKIKVVVNATVVKSADTLALGASSERSGGSSPLSGTKELQVTALSASEGMCSGSEHRTDAACNTHPV